MQRQDPYDLRNHMPPLSRTNPVSTMISQVRYVIYNTTKEAYNALVKFRDSFDKQLSRSFSSEREPTDQSPDLTHLFRKKK